MLRPTEHKTEKSIKKEPITKVDNIVTRRFEGRKVSPRNV
jgi:hypothetical protein